MIGTRTPRTAIAAACVALVLSGMSARAADTSLIDGGRFGQVRYYQPTAPRTVTGLVALVSDREGWNDSDAALATHLADEGQAVVGIDLPTFEQALAREPGDCGWVNGDFESVTRRVEKDLPFHEFRPPALVGIGAGASIAYAAVGQVLPNTFAGAVGIDFSPRLDAAPKLCLPVDANVSGQPARYAPLGERATPFVFEPSRDFASSRGQVTAFLAGSRQVHRIDVKGNQAALVDAGLRMLPRLFPSAIPVTGLPIVELSADDGADSDHPIVIFYSGDGGWRDIDKQIGGYLAEQGYFVVGFDSLRYFWREKEPEKMAADLDSVVRHYEDRSNGHGVILAGYSFGADVLPFIVNRMAPDTRKQIKLMSLIGLSEHASFEIRLQGILGADNEDGPPTVPELARIKDIPIQCVYGFDENDTACTDKALSQMVERVEMSGGHHLNGDYHDVANAIVTAAKGKVGE
ncbi:MAG TPA: AcvB/VirJ family lysyl-phosphatidylglycerol hydrolase [Alphaproteobacteria bacterium]|nr:AcvB/VirJ family lysyl-phosphatidylglycerol hydrolase [Alphaproteobacteria bacterium]